MACILSNSTSFGVGIFMSIRLQHIPFVKSDGYVDLSLFPTHWSFDWIIFLRQFKSQSAFEIKFPPNEQKHPRILKLALLSPDRFFFFESKII